MSRQIGLSVTVDKPLITQKKNSALSQYLLLGQSVTISHSQSSITSSSKPQPRVHKLITTCLSAILWARHQIHQSPFDGEVSQQTIAKSISFTVPIMMSHFFFHCPFLSRAKRKTRKTGHAPWHVANGVDCCPVLYFIAV